MTAEYLFGCQANEQENLRNCSVSNYKSTQNNIHLAKGNSNAIYLAMNFNVRPKYCWKFRFCWKMISEENDRKGIKSYQGKATQSKYLLNWMMAKSHFFIKYSKLINTDSTSACIECAQLILNYLLVMSHIRVGSIAQNIYSIIGISIKSILYSTIF